MGQAMIYALELPDFGEAVMFTEDESDLADVYREQEQARQAAWERTARRQCGIGL
jgi:hypothetical protein